MKQPHDHQFDDLSPRHRNGEISDMESNTIEMHYLRGFAHGLYTAGCYPAGVNPPYIQLAEWREKVKRAMQRGAKASIPLMMDLLLEQVGRSPTRHASGS